jgi:PAS domain S-box-containing protein
MADVKILLIEDERIEAMDIKQTLESFGYEVPLVASSIEEALKKALEIMPDLILMDKDFNKENINIDTVVDIKKLNIPIIYLTDNLEWVDLKNDSNTKQLNYLIKPYDPLELKYVIDTTISKNMIEKEFNYYRTIFEHIGTASVIIEEDSTISLVNSEFENLSGYSRDELKGKKWTDFVVQEDIEKMREYHYLRRTNSKSIPLVYDFRLIAKGGIVKDIHLDIGLIPGSKKSVATLLDISDSKNAQNKILSKEKELTTIYDNISEILYLLKVEEGDKYSFMSVNSAFLHTTGLTEKQVIGKYIQDVIPKPSLEVVLDNYKTAILEKRTVRWEEITEYPSGKKYGEVSVTPTFDADGNCTKLIGTVHDITECVEMHKEILFKTTLLEAQLESTIDGVLVADENGKFILFNTRFGEMWNIPKKLLESNNNEMIYEFILNQLKNPEIFARRIEHLFFNEAEKSLDEIEFKDGKTYESYSSPLIDLTDQNKGRIWYFRDVTESRRSQEALIESENKYSSLFNNADDGIFLLKEGRFIDCNKNVLESYGLTKDQIIGRTPYSFSPKLQPDGKKSKDKSIEFINKALNGHPQHFEWEHKRYDGTPFIVEVTLNRIKIKDEYLIQAMVRDITDRKKSEEKIDKLSRLYATLSQINQAVVRIKNKNDLFKTICSVCVEYGKFEMAWIGIIDKETGNIVPVEHHGNENGYLKKIQLNITDAPSLKKPSITAIKKGTISISDNIKNDLNRQWCYEALNRNYQSLVSIPLKLKGEIIGILNIYSSKPNFFRGEEIDLIKEMGSDISFALNTIETKKEKKLIEKSLLESARNYRELVDNSLVGVYKTNLNGDILFANDSMAHIFQYDNVEELKKENIKDLYKTKDDRIKFINKLEKDGQVTDYELKIMGKYGQLVNTVISASLAEGIISGMLMDITDRKQSEEKFKALINNSSDLIRILDKNGIITFDSPSSTRILGYLEDYFIGKSPLDFIHPDDLERVKKDLNEVFENHNPGTPTEFRIHKADGTYIYVESVSQNMFKIPYINGIVVTTHPIQQRKEMEDKLIENEKKYRTLFEEDPDYTILLKPDGTILDVNNATTEIAGLSQKELIGENFTELKIIPPEDMKYHLNRISSLLKGEDIEPFESRFIDKNGDIHWVLVRFTAVKGNKDVNYILGIATDITEYKIATNEIKSSLREKNILIQEIHHRVKNNMQIISSLLNLQKQYVDEKEAVNVLMESQNRVKSMSLIHEKLYLSKDLTHINFAEYIESLVMNLFYTYNVKENIIKPILEIDDVNLNMETAVPCGLIISETISNSLKYAFPNEMTGEIYISLKSIEDKYELIIRDNGIGLPDELDFNNLDSLGLLLVNNLTDQIDGELKINNYSGTEFKITFKELEYKNRM